MTPSFWSEILVRRSSGGSGLLQNLHGLAHLCDSEDQERCIGGGFGPTAAVVDVDTRVAEPRCGPRQLSGMMGKFDLRNFALCVISALPIQNGLGLGRIVYNETDRTFALLVRKLLIRQNVDIFLGEGL